MSVISMIISKYLDHIWFYNRGVCFCTCFSICILQCSDYVDVSVLSIKVWDKNEFKVIASYQGHVAGVECVSCAPKDQHLFLSCAQDGRVLLWDTRKAKPATAIGEMNQVSCMFRLAICHVHFFPTFSPLLYSFVYLSGSCSFALLSITLLFLHRDILLHADMKPAGALPSCVAWNPFSSRGIAVATETGHIGLRDLNSLVIPLAHTAVHSRPVTRLKFSPHSAAWLASAGEDCRVFVSNAEDKLSLIRTVRRHEVKGSILVHCSQGKLPACFVVSCTLPFQGSIRCLSWISGSLPRSHPYCICFSSSPHLTCCICFSSSPHLTFLKQTLSESKD
uniref:Methylosome protein WDR77 n=1 Tax=Eptatretus burgeri TaxID=7764 RepID=A0A8C4N2Y4_EPTBU